MMKRIAFFTVGFAFNRLIRMKFYESIFPKNVEIYLITTNKYKGLEKEKYQQDYTGLKRTKIIKLDYNYKLPFKLRKICSKEKIDRILNLGYHTSWPLLSFSTINTKSDYCLNVLTDMFNQYKLVENYKEKFKEFITMLYMYPGLMFSKKAFFTDRLDAIRAPIISFRGEKSMIWLAAPVNTNLFKIKNKANCRKKLGLKDKDKIIIFVGRVNYLKGSDLLKKIIVANPNITFIVIGKVIDTNFLGFKQNNLITIEKKNSEDLVDYYNSADLSFCFNRGGGGIGLSTTEALACGVPVIVNKAFKLEENETVIQTEADHLKINEIIHNYFNKKQKDKVKNVARKYVLDNYSDKAWKRKYLNAYLN